MIYLKQNEETSIDLMTERPEYEEYIKINNRLLYLENELESDFKTEGKIENNITKL